MDSTFNTRLDQIATFSDASATSSAKFDEFAKSPDDLSGIKKTVKLRHLGYYKLTWFYQLSWESKLAIIKNFESWWRFERQPFVIAKNVNKTKLSLTICMA